MTPTQKALALLSPGSRVLDLRDDRETHVVAAEVVRRGGRDTVAVQVWFDANLHRLTGTGTVRSLNELVPL